MAKSKNFDENEVLRYDRMVETALRNVVRQAVDEVIAHGEPPGDHHFYITFLTDHPGVKIPDYLRERYPGEMTIVLQFQYYDLSVDEEKLAVTLSFNNALERLIVPLKAISIFADPSVNFALQFQPMGERDDEEDDDGSDGGGAGGPPSGPGGKKKKPKSDAGDGAKMGEVVSLDQFRKK
jgi:hypothetical protein